MAKTPRILRSSPKNSAKRHQPVFGEFEGRSCIDKAGGGGGSGDCDCGDDEGSGDDKAGDGGSGDDEGDGGDGGSGGDEGTCVLCGISSFFESLGEGLLPCEEHRVPWSDRA